MDLQKLSGKGCCPARKAVALTLFHPLGRSIGNSILFKTLGKHQDNKGDKVPIQYPEILEVASEPRTCRWTEKDSMLYALGAGLGQDPLDADNLRYVYEKGLRALPTQATVITWGAGPTIEQMGFNVALCVHAEESLEIHRPLPASGEAISWGRVSRVIDRGEGKGAFISWELLLADAATREPIATLTTTTLARGDGGCGAPGEGAEMPHKVPSRVPDLSVDVPTRPEQALLYRLSGDMNPLHANPSFARKVGFDRPILHGLCTYAIACHAVLKAFGQADPSLLKRHQVRFSAPVLPGDVLSIDMWRDATEDEITISFEVRVKERNTVVIKGGKTVLRAGTSTV